MKKIIFVLGFICGSISLAANLKIDGQVADGVQLSSIVASYGSGGFFCDGTEEVQGEVIQNKKNQIQINFEYPAKVRGGGLFCGHVYLFAMELDYKILKNDFGLQYTGYSSIHFSAKEENKPLQLDQLNMACKDGFSIRDSAFSYEESSSFAECRNASSNQFPDFNISDQGKNYIHNLNISTERFPEVVVDAAHLLQVKEVPQWNVRFEFYARDQKKILPLDVVQVKAIQPNEKTKFPVGIFRMLTTSLDKSGVPVYFTTQFTTKNGKGSPQGYRVYFNDLKLYSPEFYIDWYTHCKEGTGAPVLVKAKELNGKQKDGELSRDLDSKSICTPLSF